MLAGHSSLSLSLSLTLLFEVRLNTYLVYDTVLTHLTTYAGSILGNMLIPQ